MQDYQYRPETYTPPDGSGTDNFPTGIRNAALDAWGPPTVAQTSKDIEDDPAVKGDKVASKSWKSDGKGGSGSERDSYLDRILG